MRLAGKTYSGKAEAIRDDSAKLLLVKEFLQHRPRDAKGYGVKPGPHDELSEDTLRKLSPHLVPLVVRLD